jgi:hypothetical protein
MAYEIQVAVKDPHILWASAPQFEDYFSTREGAENMLHERVSKKYHKYYRVVSVWTFDPAYDDIDELPGFESDAQQDLGYVSR